MTETEDARMTWVYHRDGDSRCVPAAEAERLLEDKDWADTPAAFGEEEAPVEADVDWKTVDVKDVSKDELIAKAVDLGIDPPDRAKKAEILELIWAKLAPEPEE